MSDSTKLKSYLVKVRHDLPRGHEDAYALFFCRGEGKCRRSKAKQALSKKPCEDCLKPEETLTLGEVANRLAKGDA